MYKSVLMMMRVVLKVLFHRLTVYGLFAIIYKLIIISRIAYIEIKRFN